MKNYSQNSGIQSFIGKTSNWLTRYLGAAALLISPSLAFAQPTYCPAAHAVDCTANFIDAVEVVGTTLNNTATGCTGTSGLAWSTYPASGNTTATLQPGQTYTFNITTSHNSIISVWIDFNQDGNFDATEHTQVTTTSTANTVNTASITIPATATVGLTGMRVRDRLNGNPNGPGDACLSFGSGESEDYVVTIGTPTPCTGLPTVSAATANPTTSCLNGTAKISATGFGTATGGLTFQWQQSNSNAGPWSNVTGGANANSSVYTTGPLTQGTWFRLAVTCTNSGQTANSAPVQVTNTGIPCYCPAAHTATCTNNHIDQVEIVGTTLNNNASGCGNVTSQAYSVYSPTGNTTGALQPGQTYTINIFTTANNRISLWIDYNRDGNFDASEHTQVTTTSTANSINTATFTVPITATPGITGMRVRSRNSATANGPGDACLSFTSGETEDYFVTINTPAPCAGTPTVGPASTSNNSICLNSTSTVTASGFGTATGGLALQWEQASSLNGPWSNVTGGSGANTPTFTTGQLGQTTFFRLKVTCAGSGQTATSTPVEVTVTGVPCYCEPVHSTNCSATTNIESFEIVGTTLVNNATGCTGTTGQGYTVYPATGSTTATLIPGQTYTFNITSTGNLILSIWIDYNRDGIYDASEHTQVATTTTTGSVNSASITIPVTAQVGLTGLRVRARLNGNPNGPDDACLSFASGESEEYLIQLGTPTPCTGTPNGGTATITAQSSCANSTATITSTGATSGQVGLTYQWEESNSNSGPWTAVTTGTGGNQLSYTTAPLTASKWYRLVVTCTSSSQTAISTPVEVVITGVPCYCTANLHSSNCTAADNINSVVIVGTGLSNTNTGCNGTSATPAYSLSSVTTSLSRGATYTLNITSSSASAIEYWIDYNRNGVYDANLTEWKLVTPASVGGSVSTTTFTVPNSAQLGQTGMRIRIIDAADFSQVTPSSACNNFDSGETEDYIVTIDSGTGLEEELSAAVSVIPNPTSGNVTLQLPTVLTSGTLISVFDANGREVYKSAATGGLTQELNLNGLADGLYILQTTLNNQTIVKRIAVQK